MKTEDIAILGALGLGAIFIFKKDVSNVTQGLAQTTQGIGTGVQGIGTGVSTAFQGTGTGVSDAFQGVGGGIGTIGKEAGELVKNVGNIGDAFGDVISGGIRKTGELSGDFVDYVTTLPQKTQDTIKNLSSGAVFTLQNIFNKDKSLKNTSTKNYNAPNTQTGSIYLDLLYDNSQKETFPSVFNMVSSSSSKSLKTGSGSSSSKTYSRSSSSSSSSSSKITSKSLKKGESYGGFTNNSPINKVTVSTGNLGVSKYTGNPIKSYIKIS
jgi:hypothetical protein